MLKEFLMSAGIKSQASYVEMGFGQVEPNHLSAQYTGQIYAQLPADKDINVLEQGQFAKYDYEKGLVNFTGEGEWMLVYNEIKLYRKHQLDCEFAMIKGNYQARVYSPLDADKKEEIYGPTRLLQGRREIYAPNHPDADADGFVALPLIGKPVMGEDGKYDAEASAANVADFSVASTVHDYYEMNDINDDRIKEGYRRRLFMKLRDRGNREKMMPDGTTMVPRLLKTNVGDHFTTNTINATELTLGQKLYVGEKGILTTAKAEASDTFAGSGDMVWKVVKVYTMPDHQKGVKILRIA